MNTSKYSSGIPQKALILAILIPLIGNFWVVQPVHATSIADLQKQQAALEAQAEAAQAQADASKTLAQRAAETIQRVSSQISTLKSNISATQADIASTQGQISDDDQQLAQLESQMSTVQNQENLMLRQLYIMRESMPDDLMVVFSDQTISKQSQDKAQFQALEKYLTGAYAQLVTSKQQVDSARTALVLKSQQLAALQQQQQSQQQTLADAKSTQQSLQSNALAAEQNLEGQAAKAKADAAKIAQKIVLLTYTSNWGDQIISSDDPSWYYTQTGDYTRLGYSYETVNNVGCLITSIAMVATYYGHHITPDYIARNGSFSSQGYYYWGTPSGLGVNIQPSGGVNWGVVQNEIAHNRPVIVSIYLPSVGAINSDGSSHFIVIKGYANGKYLMHDPIGDGRSYNLNQVRSMILTSPQ